MNAKATTVGFREVEQVARRLALAGYPGLSPFWRRTLERFLGSRRRTLVVRVGRRGGKSETACKVAVAFGVLGAWRSPPGTPVVVAIVSVSIAEAQNKIEIIRAMLDVLGVRVARSTATEIELADRQVVFRAFAANARTVVGFGAALVIVDEAARLRDEATGANPCSEIVASLRPSLLTHPGSRLLMISSPLGLGDYHAEQFARGDTDDQMVASAASWEANPTLSEQATRELEPDPRIWAREYAARPQASALGAFEVEDMDRAFTRPANVLRRHQVALAVDAASGGPRGDNFGASAGGWADLLDDGSMLVIDEVSSFSSATIRARGIESIIGSLVAKARIHGATRVFGDQREALLLRSNFRREGLSFTELTWTATSKPRGIARLRRLMLERRISLPKHERLRREMLALEERIDSSGQITFSSTHVGDHLATLVTMMLADEKRLLAGSPLTRTSSPNDLGTQAWTNQPAPDGAFASFGRGFGLAPIAESSSDVLKRIVERPNGTLAIAPRAHGSASSVFGSGRGGFGAF